MLKFTLQNKRKAQTAGSTSGSEAPGSPNSGSFTSSASSSSSKSGSRRAIEQHDGRTSTTPRRPSSLAPSDDSEGKSPSETNSTSQDSDLGSFTMEITGENHGNRSRKNVSFEPQDTVYMIESAHDSSSGIASDEHNSSPNGHNTTSTSDPTYGFPPTKPEPPPLRYPGDNRYGPKAYPNHPNPAFRDMPPQHQTHQLFRPMGYSEKEQALSPRARLPEPVTNSKQQLLNQHDQRHQRCLSPNREYHRTFSPLTTEEMIFNQKNRFMYVNSPQTIHLQSQHQQPPYPSHHPHHTHLPDNRHLITFTGAGKKVVKDPKQSWFDLLPDDVIIRIFSNLTSTQLCRNTRVCRRWYHLAWEPSLWTSIHISGSTIDVDKSLKLLTRRLSYDTPSVCVMVEKIFLNGCEKLTDKGLHTIAKRCPELRHLEVQGCQNISNIALFEVVSKCVNMEHLNVAGCPEITCICLTPEATVQAPAYGRQIYLRYLDMTDCFALEDSGLQIIASYCPQLVFLYMRRCLRVTDLGVQYVANYCTNIREFSISDCRKVTDFGMRELAKLGSNLRYLSVAKCDKISDVGVKYIAQNCSKLRYLNVRGCEAVSDDAIELTAKFCKRLKSLDIGKCDVTDEGLQLLAENCPQLKRLSLKSCDAITDRGVTVMAYYCRQLQQLNIQDCQVSVESYRAVKKYCKRCIIEHTNPGFY